MSPKIEELMQQRDNQLKTTRQTLHQSDWEEYRIFCRKIKATIREAEIVLFEKKFHQSE